MEELDIGEAVKEHLGIDKPDEDMDDAEIATVCRCFGIHSGSIHNMIFLALMDYPDFYQRWHLYHHN